MDIKYIFGNLLFKTLLKIIKKKIFNIIYNFLWGFTIIEMQLEILGFLGFLH